MRKYFKTHIICEDGRYYVRRYSFTLGWLFLGVPCSVIPKNYWWDSMFQKNGAFNTIEDARAEYKSRKTKIQKQIYYI